MLDKRDNGLLNIQKMPFPTQKSPKFMLWVGGS